jgi:hypothetical protein
MAPKVSKTKGKNCCHIDATLSPYFLIFELSLCLANYRGVIMDRFSELAKDIMGWITVTSANKGVESLDVIVRSILPSPVKS